MAPMSPKNASSRWPAKTGPPPSAHDRLRRPAAVVRGRARADVVRRGRPARASGFSFRHVTVSSGRCCRGRTPVRAREAEPVDEVRPERRRPVDVDVVPGARRERVLVRAGGRVLPGIQFETIVTCSAGPGCGTRTGRCCPQSGPPRSAAPPGGSRRCSRSGRSRRAPRRRPASAVAASANERSQWFLHSPHSCVVGWADTRLVRRPPPSGSRRGSTPLSKGTDRWLTRESGLLLACAPTLITFRSRPASSMGALPMRGTRSRSPLRRGARHACRPRVTKQPSRSSTTASAARVRPRLSGAAGRALAQDAVQEAFLGVWRSAGSFLPERAKASTGS